MTNIDIFALGFLSSVVIAWASWITIKVVRK